METVTKRSIMCAVVLWQVGAAALRAADPLPEAWDYSAAMKKVAAEFTGREGVVIHVGDSITYANPYGQWATAGQGMSEADKALLAWMHTGSHDDTDGWYLASFDHPAGGRSYTAAGGIRLDEMLAGGRGGLPALAELVRTYKPQMVVLMLGSNDVSQLRSVKEFIRDAGTAIDIIEAAHAIPILSTIPPHVVRPKLARAYNDALRDMARERELPLVDYEREILTRRPNDWNGTLMNLNDVHPTAEIAGENGVKASSAPTEDNLMRSGYLLRGWLSVRKIGEVKHKVLE